MIAAARPHQMSLKKIQIIEKNTLDRMFVLTRPNGIEFNKQKVCNRSANHRQQKKGPAPIANPRLA